MLDQFIKQFGSNIEQLTTQLPKLPIAEIQSQLQEVAKTTFSKMDLVSREEFDVQAAMLMKYRERVIQLEERMLELEELISQSEKKTAEK